MEPLATISLHQIERYRGSKRKLEQMAVAFSGTLKNPRDPGKILLLNDPFSQQGFLYEFRAVDILYAEECPNLAMPDGSAVPIVRLWVKKGATALKIVPFHVQDTTESVRDFF